MIGFDIGFLEPSQSQELKWLNRIQQQLHALDTDSEALTDFLATAQKQVDNLTTINVSPTLSESHRHR